MRYVAVLLFVLGILTPAAQAAPDVQIGPVGLKFGATVEELASRLPPDVRLSEAVRGSGREMANLLEGETVLAILTFDGGRLVRSTRIIERLDFSSTPSEQLAKALVDTLAAWPPGEPLQVEASDLAEGEDALQELVFRSGVRRLVLTRTARMTQLVEHTGPLNE